VKAVTWNGRSAIRPRGPLRRVETKATSIAIFFWDTESRKSAQYPYLPSTSSTSFPSPPQMPCFRAHVTAESKSNGGRVASAVTTNKPSLANQRQRCSTTLCCARPSNVCNTPHSDIVKLDQSSSRLVRPHASSTFTAPLSEAVHHNLRGLSHGNDWCFFV
jgi:hypothetical protein